MARKPKDHQRLNIKMDTAKYHMLKAVAAVENDTMTNVLESLVGEKYRQLGIAAGNVDSTINAAVARFEQKLRKTLQEQSQRRKD